MAKRTKKTNQTVTIPNKSISLDTDYLVAYKASVYITNGQETVPVYEDRIFSDILTLEGNFAVSKGLIDGFKNIISRSIVNTIQNSLSDGYQPDIEVNILAITKVEK